MGPAEQQHALVFARRMGVSRRDKRKAEREKIKRTLEREQFQPGVQPTQCADTQYVDAQCVDAQCVGSPSASFLRLVRAIEANDRSKLGLVSLRSSAHATNAWVHASWLHAHVLTTAGLSPDNCWLAREPRLSLLAYASRLARDGCVASLLFAGADPTLRCPESIDTQLGEQIRNARLRNRPPSPAPPPFPPFYELTTTCAKHPPTPPAYTTPPTHPHPHPTPPPPQPSTPPPQVSSQSFAP